MIAIADTSVLIALGAVGKLDLLQKMWKVVFVPPAVLREIATEKPGSVPVFKAITEGWLVVKPVKDKFAFHGLGPGETECLLLAQKIRPDAVLMDEARGRKIALSKGFRVIGTVGIVLKGLKSGTLTRADVPLILKKWGEINFRLSTDLVHLLKNT